MMNNDTRNQPHSQKNQPRPLNPVLSPTVFANVAPQKNEPQAQVTGVQVLAGTQLPPSAASLPKLVPQQTMPADETAAEYSAIAHGMTFQGNATLRGGCMIGGNVVGNFSQAEGTQIHITVTETGTVRGDLKAHQIAVMGSTHGLLDAHAGSVTLHETANVQGHVLYAKLQVNGAELNATLEKSTAKNHVA
jgi:cytoskeletal protein CcmA (bactofilin family)